MNTGQGTTSQTKRGRDKRAWKLSLAFCVAIAGSVIISFELASHIYTETEASYLVTTSAVLSLFICPAILAAIARRRWLLWAYVPWLAFIASIWVGPSIVSMQPDPAPLSGTYTVTVTSTTTVWDGFWVVAAFVLSPLVTAGPVCLYRVFRRRARTTELKRQAAIDEAIHSHREGSWPPPVDRGSAQ